MPRLTFEKHFIRCAHKIVKNSTELDSKLSDVLSTLKTDPFSSGLKTHPLSGKHKGKHACSLTYDLRIVFKLYDDIVHLLDIGTHDEVY